MAARSFEPERVNMRSTLHRITHQDPQFGWDDWLNPRTQPPEGGFTLEHMQAAAAALGARTYFGADTIGGDIRLLPPGLDLYASYVDNYGGWNELVARLGVTGAFLLSITIFGDPAHCADVQPGAMHVDNLAHWLDHVALPVPLDPGWPWVYTSASNMRACNDQIGRRQVIRFSAHYGFGYHVCGPATCGWPQADWTQCFDKGPHGENYDRSIGLVLPRRTPTPPPTPPPPSGTGVDMIAETANQDGRREVFAALKNGQIKHIWQEIATDGSLHWHGEPNVTAYKWENLGNVGGTPVGIAAGRNEQGGTLEVEVKLDDGTVRHCWQNVAGGGWHGQDTGVVCVWEPFGNPGV